jgi:glyoxylase-like metal-dependent hydrolase (beta-lactamase superfamily II)
VRRSVLLLAIVVLLSSIGTRAPARTRAQIEPNGYFQTAQRLAPHVWLLAQPTFQVQPVGNVTVIEQQDGLLLFDAGGSPGSGRRIVEAIRRLSAKPVKAVILSHWHGDHVQGLSEVLKAWPHAATIATAATQAHLHDPRTMNSPGVPDRAANLALQARIQGFADYALNMERRAATRPEQVGWGSARRLFERYGQDMDGALTVAPDIGFESQVALPDRETPVEVRYLGRANTDGDAIVWLPKQHILVTGDLIVAPVPFGYGSYPREWANVLRTLERYPFTILVPGHGAPQANARYLRRLVEALDQVRAQVSSRAVAGVNLDSVTRRVDLSGQARTFVGDDPWLQRWFKAYWIDPIIVSAYKEARGEPIVQSLGGD